MNNKFESKSEAEARQYLTEMFEAGCEWEGGGKDYHPLNYNYYFCRNGKITHGEVSYFWNGNSDLPTYELKNQPEPVCHPNTGVDYVDMPFLTPDFSELKVGDPVKCVMRGDGVVKTIADIESGRVIAVVFNTHKQHHTYDITGRSVTILNPTLFYPFSGQFPTAEACVRPKPDPYELHGVTQFEIKHFITMANTLSGSVGKKIYWTSNGFAYIELDNTAVYRCKPLDQPAPYEHWETPIILGGE